MHWCFLTLALLLGCSRPIPEPEVDAALDAGAWRDVYGVEVKGEVHFCHSTVNGHNVEDPNCDEEGGAPARLRRHHTMGVRKPHPPDPRVVDCQERFGATDWKTFKACLDAIPAGAR